MLAICLPNGVSRSNNAISHVKCLIFCPILTQVEFSRQNCNKVSRYKISQNSAHRETSCFKRTGKLTGSHEEASSSLYRDSANASRIFNG